MKQSIKKLLLNGISLLITCVALSQDCGYRYFEDTTATQIDSTCTDTIMQVKYTCYTGKGWFRHKAACYRFDTSHTCTYDTSYTIVTDSVALPCSTSVKPQLSGLAIRQETFFNSTNPDTAFLNAVGGNIVIREYAKDIWTSRNTYDFSYLDSWIAFANYWTARGMPIHYKLRITFGVLAPQWMRDSVGAFPLSSAGYETTPGYNEADDSCIKFWTPAFLDLHQEFMEALSERYDTVQCISEITVTGTTAGTGEPLIYGVGNAGAGLTRRNQFIAAGATNENILAAVYRSIDNMNAFQYTNIGIAASPYQRISVPSYEDTSVTKSIDAYVASLFRERAVLGNNGLQFMNPAMVVDNTWLPGGKMYQLQQDYILNRNTFGSRIYNQTAAQNQMGGYGNLITVLNAGVNFGDILIELPDTETKIKQILSNLQLRTYRDLCKQNE